MHTDYEDILSRIAEDPKWFDEHAVPRFDPFDPSLIANIYADECALLEIRCQSCEHVFHVAVSTAFASRVFEAVRRGEDAVCTARGSTLVRRIDDGALEYGDPPNIGCCPPGPTMYSVPVRVLQYWRRETNFEWKRRSAHEVRLKVSWASPET